MESARWLHNFGYLSGRKCIRFVGLVDFWTSYVMSSVLCALSFLRRILSVSFLSISTFLSRCVHVVHCLVSEAMDLLASMLNFQARTSKTHIIDLRLTRFSGSTSRISCHRLPGSNHSS